MIPSLLFPELMVRIRAFTWGKSKRTKVISVPSSTNSALVSNLTPLHHTSSDSFSGWQVNEVKVRV